MIPVYPWPFHPEYYRRREVLEDRRRRLNALGKPVWPDSDAPTACHSLGQAIRANPFPQSFSDPGHLNISGRDDIGADVIMDGLPEDSPPLVSATREWYASINARTLQSHIPNHWEGIDITDRNNTGDNRETGHRELTGKFVCLRNHERSVRWFTSPPYWNFAGYNFGGTTYYVPTRSRSIFAMGSLGDEEIHYYNQWVGLRLGGTMETGGQTAATGHRLTAALANSWYIPDWQNSPEFEAYAAAAGKTVVTYPGSLYAIDRSSPSSFETYTVPMPIAADGGDWITLERTLRQGLAHWQFYNRSPAAPVMEGAVIQYEPFAIGAEYILTEDGTLYRSDNESRTITVRATGVYLISTNPPRIYFDNGTEEDL